MPIWRIPPQPQRSIPKRVMYSIDTTIPVTDTAVAGNVPTLSIGINLLPPIALTIRGLGGGGYALQFDGVDDNVNCGNNASMAFGSGNFTIEGWVKRTSATGTLEWMITKSPYTGDGKGWRFGLNASNKLYFRDLTGAVNLTFNTALTQNVWSYIAVVRSGTTVTGYKDGSSDGTGTVSSNFNDTHRVYLGATPNTTYTTWYDTWTGLMGQFRLSNVARTSTEMTANWNSGVGKAFEYDTNTVALWCMDEGTGATINDETTLNNGTIYQATWTTGFLPVGIPTLNMGAGVDVPLADTVNGLGYLVTFIISSNLLPPVATTVDGVGLTPEVQISKEILIPLAETITSLGYIPTFSLGINLLPPVATTIDGAGLVPSFILGINLLPPVADTIASAGLIPTFVLGINLLPPVADISGAGLAPTFSLDINLLPPVATTVVGAGLVPTFSLGINLLPPVADISGAGLAPAFSLGINLSIPLANIDVVAYAVLEPIILKVIELIVRYFTHSYDVVYPKRDVEVTYHDRSADVIYPDRDMVVKYHDRDFIVRDEEG